MPAAVFLTLLDEYGPSVIALVLKYGPTVIAWVEKAAADGTLEADLAAVVAAMKRLVPLVGDLTSLAALGDLMGQIDIEPAQPEDPAMARVAPEHKMGGR